MPKKGRFKPGDPAAAKRSAHHGYDCYLIGPEDDRGQVSCRIRHGKLPATIDEDLKLVLPPMLIWPFRDHACAHEMIDAVLEKDVAQMEAWLQLYADHRFGFEDYLLWCREQGGLKGPSLTSHPVGEPSHQDRIARVPMGNYLIDIHILRYPHGDAWGQATMHARGSVLTRYLIELQSGREIVTEHYPGRWKAIGHRNLCALATIRKHRRLIRPKKTPVRHLTPAIGA